MDDRDDRNTNSRLRFVEHMITQLTRRVTDLEDGVPSKRQVHDAANTAQDALTVAKDTNRRVDRIEHWVAEHTVAVRNLTRTLRRMSLGKTRRVMWAAVIASVVGGAIVYAAWGRDEKATADRSDVDGPGSRAGSGAGSGDGSAIGFGVPPP